MNPMRTGACALLVLAMTVPVSCVDWAPRSSRQTIIRSIPNLLTLNGGQVAVNIGIPNRWRTQANDAVRGVDVVQVEIKLYAKHAAHVTYDYLTLGTALYTSTGYTWSGGLDTSGNNQYTLSNIPISATPYVVIGRAYINPGPTNVTKTDGNGYTYARSSNDVSIVEGSTTYSSGSALALTIPLLDALGGDVEIQTTFTNGGAGPAVTGNDS